MVYFSDRYKTCPLCGSALAKTQITDSYRNACPNSDCDFVDWNNPTPVVAAIPQKEDSVVLVQGIGWPKHWFSLVTGFLEKNETPQEGARREVNEELGLDCQAANLVGVYSFFQMNQVIIAYHVLLEEGEITLDPTELVDHKTIPIDKLRPWPSGTGEAVRDWLSTQGIENEPIPFGKPKK